MATTTTSTATARSTGVPLSWAALVTGPFFLLEVALNSWLSRDFLHAHGWTLRTGQPHDLPWPSMLALGPHGWAQMVGFAVAGLGVLSVVPGLARLLPRTKLRPVALVLLSLMGAAITLSAVPLDASTLGGDDPTTWHGWVHGLMFLVLVPTSLLAPLLIGLAAWWDPRLRTVTVACCGAAPAELAAVLSQQGNLGFYLYLCINFAWVAYVGLRAAIGSAGEV